MMGAFIYFRLTTKLCQGNWLCFIRMMQQRADDGGECVGAGEREQCCNVW